MTLQVAKITRSDFQQIANLAFEKEINVADALITEFGDGTSELTVEYDSKLPCLKLVIRSDFYVFQRNLTGVIFLVNNHAEIQNILRKYNSEVV